MIKNHKNIQMWKRVFYQQLKSFSFLEKRFDLKNFIKLSTNPQS